MACPVLFRRHLMLLKSPGRVWEAHFLCLLRPCFTHMETAAFTHIETHVYGDVPAKVERNGVD